MMLFLLEPNGYTVGKTMDFSNRLKHLYDGILKGSECAKKMSPHITVAPPTTRTVDTRLDGSVRSCCLCQILTSDALGFNEWQSYCWSPISLRQADHSIRWS